MQSRTVVGAGLAAAVGVALVLWWSARPWRLLALLVLAGPGALVGAAVGLLLALERLRPSQRPPPPTDPYSQLLAAMDLQADRAAGSRGKDQHGRRRSTAADAKKSSPGSPGSSPGSAPKTSSNNVSVMYRQHLRQASVLRARHFAGQSWRKTPTSRALGAGERPGSVQDVLDDLLDLFCQQYVQAWYSELAQGDPGLGVLLRDVLWEMLLNAQQQLEKMDLLTLLTNQVVKVLQRHFYAVRRSPRSMFPSHPCLASAETEQAYLRRVADALLLVLLPARLRHSPVLSTLLRELLVQQVLLYTVQLVCNPEFLNAWVVHRCRLQEAARHAQQHRAHLTRGLPSDGGSGGAGAANEPASMGFQYARTYKDFLRLIDQAQEVDTLLDMRYHIISEIMQGAHFYELQQLRRAAQHNASELAWLGDSGRAAHLAGRNLERYLNQCRHAKALCEKRIVQLGGPDFSGVEARLLTFPEILADGLALGYFVQHLQADHAAKYLQFWLACEHLRQIAGDVVDPMLLTNVCDLYFRNARDYSRLLSGSPSMELLRSEFELLLRRHRAQVEGAGSSQAKTTPSAVSMDELNCVFAVQQHVYEYLRKKYYQSFVFGDLYRKFVRHSGRETARSLNSDSSPASKAAPVTTAAASAAAVAVATLPTSKKLPGSTPSKTAHTKAVPSAVGEVDSGLEPQQAISRQIRDKMEELVRVRDRAGNTEKVSREINSLRMQNRLAKWKLDRATEWNAQRGNWMAQVQDIAMGDKGTERVVILVRNKHQEGSGWVVARSLSEFKGLHAQLKSQYPRFTASLPLPTNSGWFSSRPSHSQLKSTLNLYLQQVLQNEETQQCVALFTFLSPAEMEMSEERTADTLEMEVDAETAENKDSIAQEIYLLIAEVFELEGVFKWFRRQVVSFVQLTYGGTINRSLHELVDWLASEKQILLYLQLFKDVMFPRPAAVEEWEKQQEKAPKGDELRKLARKLLLRNVPDILTSLVGNNSCQRGVSKVFAALQNEHMNKCLMYALLETFVVAFCGNAVDTRDLASVAIPMDAEPNSVPETTPSSDLHA
eukprot:m.108910 g.108910  ORF g.108910 m.108910 type:complete len:1057 (-) comp19117_c0_seq1:190-3360(-)